MGISMVIVRKFMEFGTILLTASTMAFAIFVFKIKNKVGRIQKGAFYVNMADIIFVF